MNKFDEVYEDMTATYEKLEEIMSDLYQHLQDNPSDDMTRNTLMRLTTVAQNMLFSQKGFTSAYADPSIKEVLIDKLDSKTVALEQANENTMTQR